MENVGVKQFGKWENPEKNPKNLDIAYHNCPPGDPEIRARDLGMERRAA